MQLDLFGTPAPADSPHAQEPVALSQDEFRFGGRPLRVVREYGTDAAAPVVVEELTSRFTLKGQYALWSRQGVAREMSKQ